MALLRFDPKAGNQRPALALANGQILIAWASHEDLQPYHGWIMSYDAKTLKQTGALCTTPDMADGGIWQSGRGPAVDPAAPLISRSAMAAGMESETSAIQSLKFAPARTAWRWKIFHSTQLSTT